MARISPLVLAPLVFFAALAGLFFGGLYRDAADALPPTLIGQGAPAMDVTALGAGAPPDDAALRDGHVKLVNYWASWCVPCRIEHPQLLRLKTEGVEVFGINYKDDPGQALAFLQELGDPYDSVGADKTGRTASNWGVYGIPETFVVDGEGKVVLRFAGPITESILEKRIRPALRTASAE